LRRALGDGQNDHRYIVTVPGRGYNFVAPIRLEESFQTAPSPTIALAGAHNLPLALTRLIGREDAVAGACLATISRALGDDRRPRGHRQDDGRPGRRRVHDRKL
jgi:hypothetical protein